MNHKTLWRWLLVCSLVFSIFHRAEAASVITATLTFTNAAKLSNSVAISNALIIANSDTRKYTNSVSTPATQIRITTSLGTNIAQQVAQTLVHVSTYPFQGLTPSGDGISFIRFRGTNDQAVELSIHPNTWGAVTYSTQTVSTAYVVQVPATVVPLAARTNIWTMVWDALDTYSQKRSLTNLQVGGFSYSTLSVTGLFSTTAGQRVAMYRTNADTAITTNLYYIGVNSAAAPVKLTLPTAASSSNHVWIVVDDYGAGTTNTIIVTNAGTDTIRGLNKISISNNFGALILFSQGTNFTAAGISIDPAAGDGANLGGGVGWPTYDSKSGTSLRFNTFTNGAGLQSASNANVITWSVINDGITDAMLRESAAVSVIGRSANSTGNPADIAAAANYRILTRESDSLAFRQITLTNFLSDIAWGPISDGDALQWRAVFGKWTNAPVTSSTDTLPELTDVADAFPSLADGDVLMYDVVSGKWTNAVPPGAGGGEANLGGNLGGSWNTYDSKSGVTLRFNTWTNGPGLMSSSNANLLTMAIAPTVNIGQLLVTNAIGRARSLVPSPNTTNQIDVASGPTAYYWTNMATNIVLQCTNVWTAGVTNRTLDFYFTGHASLPFTVTFSCPNPAGVAFRWGFHSATNGLTSFTVTNGMAVGASVTFWETNLAEAYFSPVR